MLLGRMGKHEQALLIYVHILKDTSMAEEWVVLHKSTGNKPLFDPLSAPHRYCHRHYNSSLEGNKDVSSSLMSFRYDFALCESTFFSALQHPSPASIL